VKIDFQIFRWIFKYLFSGFSDFQEDVQNFFNIFKYLFSRFSDFQEDFHSTFLDFQIFISFFIQEKFLNVDFIPYSGKIPEC